jgi:hypothetical protein
MKNFKLFIETSDLAALVGAVVHGDYNRTPRLIVADHLDELGNTSLSHLLRLCVRKAEGDNNIEEGEYSSLFNNSVDEIEALGYTVPSIQYDHTDIHPTAMENKDITFYSLKPSGVYHFSYRDHGTLIPYNELPEGVLRAVLLIYAVRMWKSSKALGPENKRSRISAIRELRFSHLSDGDVPTDQEELTRLLIAVRDVEAIAKEPRLDRTIKDAIQTQLTISYVSCTDKIQENMVSVKLRPLMKEVTDLIHKVFNSLNPTNLRWARRSLPPVPAYRD